MINKQGGAGGGGGHSLSTVTSLEAELYRHIHFSSSRIPSAHGRSVYESEWMRREPPPVTAGAPVNIWVSCGDEKGGRGRYLVRERYAFVWVSVGESRRASSVYITEVADWLVLHYAQVVHGAAVGDLDSLANAGRATFHHFDLVYGLVHPQRNHLGSRKPLPEGKQEVCPWV